ncbi:hypothetical protein FMM80_00940 [Schaedlerella arabinosiphila]|uniref:Uncharacterized protein n=1 Tax=Schaedlerella arabinosiphila TaxID=2044587 RepID=A0A9X5H4K4_9FIRM|nr:hypothetical protein [Schaedlerella arabinosiphila]NDO67374.1 hypothetical protein [Schaedlerella arabinosiphila]
MNNNIIMIFERTGDTMCKILEKLRDKTPENLLKEYQISLVPPIDISLLMQRIGIKEIPFDFTELEKLMNLETGDIIGTVFAKNDEFYTRCSGFCR